MTFSSLRRWFGFKSKTSKQPYRRPAAQLRVEVLEDRVVPAVSATLYVDNTPGTGGTEFTATGGTQPASVGGLVAGTTLFSTIQAAITAANPGDTINVSDGTYTENLILNKALNLRGNQFGVDARSRTATETNITPAVPATHTLELQTGVAGSIINGFAFTDGTRSIESASGPLNTLQILNNRITGFTNAGIFLNDTGTDITLNQNVVDGTSKTGSGGLVHLDTDGFTGFHLTNNNIVNGATATGFFVDGNHNVVPSATRNPLIKGNLISANNTGMNLGSRAFGSATIAPVFGSYNGEISENTFSNNNFDGLQGGIQRTLITKNTFSGNGRSGLSLTSFGNAGADRGGQQTEITQNAFSTNGVAQNGEDLFFSSTQLAGTIATNFALGNSFASTKAVTYNGTESINTSGNWWGSNTGPTRATHPTGTGGTITNPVNTVDFTPWLNSGTDSDLVTPGFQGDFSGLHVDDDSPQIGAVTRINEAIAQLADGSATGSARIITVHTGTYSENVVLDKSATIQGEGTANTILDGAASGVGVAITTANSVGLRSLTVQNYVTGVTAGASTLDLELADVKLTGNTTGGTLTGVNSVVFGGNSTDETFGVSGTQFSRTGENALAYSGVTTLKIVGQGGADRLNVLGTATGTATTADGGGGDDLIVVSSIADASGVLSTMLGAITVEGGSGVNQLWISEFGSGTADTVTVTNTTVSSTTVPFSVTYQATGGTFGSGLIVLTGTAADRVNVLSLAAGNFNYVLTGNGADVVVVSSAADATGNLAGIASSLLVDAGAGTNQLWVGDQANAAASTVTVSGTAVTNSAAAGTIFYQATGGNFGNGVIVLTGSNNDNVTVTGQAAGSVAYILTGGGMDTINVSVFNNSAYFLITDGGDAADSLFVTDLSGGGTKTKFPSSATSGQFQVTYGGGGATSNIYYSTIETSI